MGGEAPETCRATHKRQVINLGNSWILLVNLFESYDDARTYEHQTYLKEFTCSIILSIIVLLLIESVLVIAISFCFLYRYN